MRFQDLYSPATNNWQQQPGLSGSERAGLGFNSHPKGKVCTWIVCSNNSLALEFNTRCSSKIKSKLQSARQPDQEEIGLYDGTHEKPGRRRGVHRRLPLLTETGNTGLSRNQSQGCELASAFSHISDYCLLHWRKHRDGGGGWVKHTKLLVTC